MEGQIICSHCGQEFPMSEKMSFDGKDYCEECLNELTFICDHCGDRFFIEEVQGDSNTYLCQECYDEHYNRCTDCDRLLSRDEVYFFEDEPYCEECYDRHESHEGPIHDYGFKPDPVFFGTGKRYFGVELEVDEAGEIIANAEKLLWIANSRSEHLYIKHDGSLSDGMELVSHPMTLDYHTNSMPWSTIMEVALSFGYQSHKTTTCGLHVHVNRTAFGDDQKQQEAAISRVLFFVENHWNELLKFSRRTQYQLNQWAARYGRKNSPKEVMDSAKKGEGGRGRYSCVNIENHDTIEFRIFRGTLLYSTFIATLQLVDEICNVAVFLSDEEMADLTWSTFVEGLSEIKVPELIQYLKRKRLYVNEVDTSGTEDE